MNCSEIIVEACTRLEILNCVHVWFEGDELYPELEYINHDHPRGMTPKVQLQFEFLRVYRFKWDEHIPEAQFLNFSFCLSIT